MTIRLYSYFRSSASWRVRIALNYKGIAHEIVPVHLSRGGGEQKSATFHQKNPIEQVPVLELAREPHPLLLTQSLAILEYLEETQPEPPLLPRDPELRARARQLAEVVNSGIQPLQNLKLQSTLRDGGVDPAPLVKSFIEFGLNALENMAQASPGRFLVGSELSFADVCLVPQLFAARRFGVDTGAYPRLLAVEGVCQLMPAFRRAHPSAQPDFDPKA